MEGIVYLITNTTTGKKYVGSTTKTLEERMKGHKQDMHDKDKSNSKFYRDMNTHGATAFTIEPIMTMTYLDIKELLMVEDAYISIYDTIINGNNTKYNVTSNVTMCPSRSLEYRRTYWKGKVPCKVCDKLVSRKHLSTHMKRTHGTPSLDTQCNLNETQ